MIKKKLAGIITIIVIAIVAVITGISTNGCRSTVSEVDEIINSNISLVEKTNKISEMTSLKKSDCENIKTQIIEVLNRLYKNEVKEHLSSDEIILKFEDYYSDSIDKIESKLKLFEVRNAIEYGNGSYASIVSASDEYNEISAFYDELSSIYNHLKKLS